MFDADGGQDQEAAVADDTRQVLSPCGIAPAQPLIARSKPPGRRTHGETADLPDRRADDQVSDLRAAQRPPPLWMIRFHQPVPPPARRRAAVDHLQFDLAQIRQRPAAVWHILRRGVLPATLRPRPPPRRWQLD